MLNDTLNPDCQSNAIPHFLELSTCEVLKDSTAPKTVCFGLYADTCNDRNIELWSEIKGALSKRGFVSTSFTYTEKNEEELVLNHRQRQRSVLSEQEKEKWVSRIAQRRNISIKTARRVSVALESRYYNSFIQHRPSMFIGWNTFEYPFGIAGDVAVALGIPVWSFETGIIPGTIRCEVKNQSSCIYNRPIDLSAYRDSGKRLLSILTPEDFSVHAQKTVWRDRLTMLCAPRPRVVVFGSVEAGAGQFPENTQEKKSTLPGFRDSLEIAESIDCGSKKTFFKPHPFGVARLPEKDSSITLLRSDPIQLITKMDAVVTTAGKLEVASVLLGKKLIRVGRSFLSGCPLGIEVKNEHELLGAMHTLSGSFDSSFQKIQLEEAIGFLYQNGWLMSCGVHRSIYGSDHSPVEKWLSRALARY